MPRGRLPATQAIPAPETETVPTEAGPLRIPTLNEMLGMKAFLAYDRNATRNYIDFALFSEGVSPEVLASLRKLNHRYRSLQTSSVDSVTGT